MRRGRERGKGMVRMSALFPSIGATCPIMVLLFFFPPNLSGFSTSMKHTNEALNMLTFSQTISFVLAKKKCKSGQKTQKDSQ